MWAYIKKMSNKHLHYIDCLRVFACFLVVTIHCNYVPSQECNKIWTQLLNVIGSPSSELFLAISGSLLLPVKISQKEFYRRRFSKLLVPLLSWSLFGLIFYCGGGESHWRMFHIIYLHCHIKQR